MKNVDGHGYLATEPFDYREGKDSKIFLFWEGRQVKIIKGRAAEKFLAKVAKLSSEGVQLELAKLTGNFKRGNERCS